MLHIPILFTFWDLVALGGSAVGSAVFVFAQAGGSPGVAWTGVAVAFLGVIVPLFRMYLADKWRRHDMANKVNAAVLSAALARREAEVAKHAADAAVEDSGQMHRRLEVSEKRNAFLEGRIQSLEGHSRAQQVRINQNQDSIEKLQSDGDPPQSP